MRGVFIVAALYFLLALPTDALAQGQRYFIGIGVNGYDHNKLTDLDFAENDIITTGRLFSEYGYRATILTTTIEPLVKPKLAKKQPNPKLVPTKANILAALKEVLNQCKKGDLVIIALAGHGLYFDKDPDDYFCPVDARPFKEDKDTLISLRSIYQMLDRSGASAKVLLADCCRNDPDPTRSRSGETFLDKEPPRGVIALYACSKDQRAYENPDLKHGVFFYHILEGLQGKVPAANDEVEFELLSRHVRINVPRTVKKLVKDDRTQVPEQKGTLQGNPLVLISRADSQLRKDWDEYLVAQKKADSAGFIKTRGPSRAASWEAMSERSVLAMVLFARCLDEGAGVTKDEKKAFEWYTKAAKLSNPIAMYNLGYCYANGLGVVKDEKKAFEWYTIASELGNPMAMHNLGCCNANAQGVAKDEKKAFEWFTKAAELGDPPAMHGLGYCYANSQGVVKDEKEAVRWYTRAAELGNSLAMYKLGTCYANGQGVLKDEKKAFEWFTKAAELGDSDALYALGICYFYGLGVEKDLDQAVRWYRKAATAGSEEAKDNLKRLGKD